MVSRRRREVQDIDIFELEISKYDVQEQQNGYHPVSISTNRGRIDCRYYPVRGSRLAAIWVGGAGGGWDSPARDLYGRISPDLQREGIASLRVRYRQANNLPECTLDVVAGLMFLESEGVEFAAVAGHSFGGAVVIQAAAASEMVRTVLCLASQTYGTDPAARLAPRCSILLVHGTQDQVLPPYCSQSIYRMASEPKKLVLVDANHGLTEVADQVYGLVKDWTIEQLLRVGSQQTSEQGQQ